MHFGRSKKRPRGMGCGKELTRVALKCIDEQRIRLGAGDLNRLFKSFSPPLPFLLFPPLFFLAVPLWELVTWDKQASAAGAGGGRANSAIAASTAANYDESQAQPPGIPYIYTHTHMYMYITYNKYIYIYAYVRAGTALAEYRRAQGERTGIAFSVSVCARVHFW